MIKLSFHTEPNERLGFFISFIAHCIFTLVLFKITIGFEVEAPVFHELTLGQISSRDIEQIIRSARERQSQQQTQGSTPSKRVEAPERLIMTIEEPTVSIPDAEKISPTPIIISPTEREFFDVSPVKKASDIPDAVLHDIEKETFDGTKIVVGDVPGQRIETNAVAQYIEPTFVIEGEGLKKLPLLHEAKIEYPENYFKEATIRIQITVLKGIVKFMLVVKKADTVLENVSMKALRQCRWESRDTEVEGIVTIEFKLKKD